MAIRVWAFGAWLLLVLAWNSDAVPTSSDGDVVHLGAVTNNNEGVKKEQAAVQRDLTELHLIEDVLSERGASSLSVQMGENVDQQPQDYTDEQKKMAAEDKAQHEHNTAVNDPLLSPAKLLKNEENVTNAREDFKGPHADVSRAIAKRGKSTNAEVFGGANEAGIKTKRIKEDAKQLSKVAEREAKELGIVIPKVNETAKEAPKDPNAIDTHSTKTSNTATTASNDKQNDQLKMKPELGMSLELDQVQLAKYAVNEIKEKTTARSRFLSLGGHKPAVRLLGEDGAPSIQKHKQGTQAPRMKRKTTPIYPGLNAPTMEAVKLEEEELVREFRNKPAVQAVDALNKFMHKAHETREKGREAWMRNKEVQAKRLQQKHLKSQKKNMKTKNMRPMSADEMSVYEGKREARVALMKAKQHARVTARQHAADSKAIEEKSMTTPAKGVVNIQRVLRESRRDSKQQQAGDSKQQKTGVGNSSTKKSSSRVSQTGKETMKTTSHGGTQSRKEARRHDSDHSSVKQSHDAAHKDNAKPASPPAEDDQKMASIQEQRPPAAAVEKALAEFGPGGTHCKDCT